MNKASSQTTDRQLDGLLFDFARVRGGPYIGPSETSPAADQETASRSEDRRIAPQLNPAETHARLDALVNACVGAPNDRSSFVKHKELLVTDLAPPYALFCFVKDNPELVDALRDHEVFEGRMRKISRSKIALLCAYCKMKPDNEKERASCSDWVVWLGGVDI